MKIPTQNIGALVLPGLLSTLLMTPLTGCTPEEAEFQDFRPATSIAVGERLFLSPVHGERIVEVALGAPGEENHSALEESSILTYHLDGIAGPLVATPDQAQLLSLIRGDENALLVLDTAKSCTQETASECMTLLESKAYHDRLEISPAGNFAISYISEQSAQRADSELLNLNEIAIYDLQALTTSYLTIGFNPKAFAFSASGAQMVILTDSDLNWVDLELQQNTKRALTSNSATHVNPKNVVIASNQNYALVTLEGSSDLYTFDLSSPSLPINILALDGKPNQMQLTHSGDKTIISTTGGGQLNIIDHQTWEVDTIPLPKGGQEIVSSNASDLVLAYTPGQPEKQLYHIDVESGRATPYLLDNPVQDVVLNPVGDTAILFYLPESPAQNALDESHAIGILDFAEGDKLPTPIIISRLPDSWEFEFDGISETERLWFTLSQSYEGTTLAHINIDTLASSITELPPNVMDLHILDESNRMMSLHQSPTGLLTVTDTQGSSFLQYLQGFMVQDLFDSTPAVVDESQETEGVQ